MLKTSAEIAKLRGITRQAVCNFITKKNIQPSGKKGKYPTYDCETEPLVSYLATDKQPAPGSAADAAETGSIPSAQPKTTSAADAASRRLSKPLNDLLAGKVPAGQKPAGIFYAEALKLAKQNQDASLYFKLGQIAAKEDAEESLRLQALNTERAKEEIAQQKAERLKIENDIKRSFYIDKSVVKLIFGRVYSVHTSTLTTIGLKLSDMIDALPEGADRRARIQKLIDDEIFSALETVQRLLIEYVNNE